MPQIDQDHVKLCGGIVVWDGVTQPEITQAGAKAGQPKWSLKVVFPPTCPDLPLFDALARKKLQESKWRGQLPHGGRMPIGMVQPGEFNDMFPGWCVISFKTTLKAPDVYAMDPTGGGVLQDPMMYTRMVYAGQTVDVLAHCYDYDAAGNKGISAGMDAFSYPINSQAPRLPFAGSGMNTGSAFGSTGAAPAAAATYGAPPASPAAAATYGAPPASPAAAATYGAPPAATYGAPPASPAYGAPPAAAAPYGAPPAATYGAPPASPAYGAPPASPAAPARVMLPAANGVPYEAYIAQGWNDAALISHGFMAPPGNGAPQQAHNYLPQ